MDKIIQTILNDTKVKSFDLDPMPLTNPTPRDTFKSVSLSPDF